MGSRFMQQSCARAAGSRACGRVQEHRNWRCWRGRTVGDTGGPSQLTFPCMRPLPAQPKKKEEKKWMKGEVQEEALDDPIAEKLRQQR